MAQKINHKETLVRVNQSNELVETVGYDKETYETGEYGIPGSEFDTINLVEGEKLVSLEELMSTNITSYTEALRSITAELED